MNNEELILERLDRIESQLAPLAYSVKSVKELKEDVTPLANNAFRILIEELESVESSCSLDDILELMKRLLRSAKSITYSLKQLENIIDFINTLEPLLHSSVPKMIHYLDDLDQRGVFRMLLATLEVRAKVAEAYTPEDIDQISDGFVSLLALTKKVSDPKTLEFMERLAEIPATIELDTCKDCGPAGLIWAAGNKEVKAGMGVLIELAKAMGRVKSNE